MHDMSTEKVDDLRAAIERGEYAVDPRAVAAAIVERLLGRRSPPPALDE